MLIKQLGLAVHDYPRSLPLPRRDGQARGLVAPIQQAELQPTPFPPRDPVQGSAAPISSHGGRLEAPKEEPSGSQSNVCEGNVTHPI